MSHSSLKPVLIRFDAGLLTRIELEVQATSSEAGRDIHRTEVIRDLITESLDLRCGRRNEDVPRIVAVSDEEMSEGVNDGPGIVVGYDFKSARSDEAPITQSGTDHPEQNRPRDLLESKPGTTPIRPQGPTPNLGPVSKARVLRTPVIVEEACSPDHGSLGMATVFALRRALDNPDFSLEGKTAVGEALGARVEGDANEGRSGGNSESTAGSGVASASIVKAISPIAIEGVEVPEVGPAGGRGWLGDSIKRIGV